MTRVTGLGRGSEDAAYAREHLWNALGAFAPVIERLSAHFDEVSRRGGAETVCRVRVALRLGGAVVADARGDDARSALDAAALTATRDVRRVIARSRPSGEQARERAHPQLNAVEAGSLIGRRVGHADVDLARALERPEKERRDQPVDTARPGVSATDRTAGGGSTARRNTKKSSAGMSYALEDSMKHRPSRKSTRRSIDRQLHDNPLNRRTIRKTHAPAARAARAAVRGG